jgi:hypothetical protein
MKKNGERRKDEKYANWKKKIELIFPLAVSIASLPGSP